MASVDNYRRAVSEESSHARAHAHTKIKPEARGNMLRREPIALHTRACTRTHAPKSNPKRGVICWGVDRSGAALGRGGLRADEPVKVGEGTAWRRGGVCTEEPVKAGEGPVVVESPLGWRGVYAEEPVGAVERLAL